MCIRDSPKSEWERSHSQKGLDGVTVVVEQASGAERILEYPPKDLGETFQAVFAGVDPEDTRKAQCFPINKKLFLLQHEFLQKHSEPNKLAKFNAADVEAWRDGVTPPVIQAKYTDVPKDDLDEEDAADKSSTKYRGPVDSTLGAQERGEDKEDVPWSFLCPDAADQELDNAACWQIAARKLQQMQDQAAAIQKEEQLAGHLARDTMGRTHLLNDAKDFQAAIGKVASGSFLRSLENALQAESLIKTEGTVEAEPKPVDHPSATLAAEEGGVPKLVVPTGKKLSLIHI